MEEKIKSIALEVNEELARLFGEKIERIILYGSYARGDFNSESDIDIMILLNCDSTEIAEYRKSISQIASRIGLQNDIMVSLLARNCKEFENNKKYQLFYQNIEKEGMNLWIKQKQIQHISFGNSQTVHYICKNFDEKIKCLGKCENRRDINITL